MRHIFALLLFLISTLGSNAIFCQPANPFEVDFLFLWNTLENNYGYFDQKQTDWEKVKEIYRPRVANVQSNYDFTLFLEDILLEIYDSHSTLNTNTDKSYRLIPSGTDLWGEFKNGGYYIIETHPQITFQDRIYPGDQVIAFNNQPIEEAVKKYIGKSFRQIEDEIKSFAFRLLIAGGYKEERVFTILRNGKERTVNLGISNFPLNNNGQLIKHKVLENNIGYIQIENSLGNNDLIPVFDDTLDELLNTNGLIIDLRNTPGGGNTTVARAIMGRFITEEKFYQKHALPINAEPYGIKRSWVELVTPRGKTYDKPVIILVNHWTGSMGEGMAVGFDGMKRATIVGTEMARLIGGIYTIYLPKTNIGVSYSREKLFHVDGTPREDFVPEVLVQPTGTDDVILKTGYNTLLKQIRTGKK